MISYHYLGHGINKYCVPDANLGKCVSDVRELSSTLATFGFSTQTFFDEQCTRNNIMKNMNSAIEKAANCEKSVLVLHQSSHGSQQKDNGTEEDDGMDEVLITHDTIWNPRLEVWDNGIVDDDIAKMFATIPSNVLVVFIADTCCSGTITRGLKPVEMVRHRKFLYPRNWIVRVRKADYASGFVPMDNKNFVLLAGASNNSYSYEGPDGGVLTSGIIRAIRSTMPGFPSRTNLIASVIDYAHKNGFDQLPHYECSEELMAKAEFCFDNEKLSQKKTEKAIGLIESVRNWFWHIFH